MAAKTTTSSVVLDPITNPQAWDVVKLGQSTSPGVCELSGFKRGHEWDIKKGKGTVGSTITFVARPPAKGSIKFKLWTAAHFDAWATFVALLKYDPTKKAVQAVDIYHPSLADIDITSVVTENIGIIVHEGDGLYSRTVDFIEYFPAPNVSAVSTPTTSQTTQDYTVPGEVAQDVPDAQQREIAALLQEATAP